MIRVAPIFFIRKIDFGIKVLLILSITKCKDRKYFTLNIIQSDSKMKKTIFVQTKYPIFNFQSKKSQILIRPINEV